MIQTLLLLNIMNSFESEYNIIHQILKNDQTYTKLIYDYAQYYHYEKYESEYQSRYNSDNQYQQFANILTGELHNNTYVNELYMTQDNCGCVSRYEKVEFIKKIIKMRNWKSIYVCGQSDSVLDALLAQQNLKLVKLQLSQLFENVDKFLKIIQSTPSLKEFELCISSTPEMDFCEIIKAILESNIKTLILCDISSRTTDFEFINGLFKSNIRNFHLKNSLCTNDFDLINNYTILNFTVNDKQPDYAYKILNRNKNYAFTVLLCMNRKIIPRCVFKNLIVKHLFIL